MRTGECTRQISCTPYSNHPDCIAGHDWYQEWLCGDGCTESEVSVKARYESDANSECKEKITSQNCRYYCECTEDNIFN